MVVVDHNSKQKFIPYDTVLGTTLLCDNPNVKELKPLRAGLHEMMQCYGRQHLAASDDLHEHPRGNSPWREAKRMKFLNSQMGYSRMRSEPSEYLWVTEVIWIHLESHFEERTQEVWERNWMNPDMHTTLLDMNILKPMEMILMVLREQSEDYDQMNTAGELLILIPETLH